MHSLKKENKNGGKYCNICQNLRITKGENTTKLNIKTARVIAIAGIIIFVISLFINNLLAKTIGSIGLIVSVPLIFALVLK